MKKYIIITAAEVANVDYSKVLQNSINTVRHSLNGSLALVSFYGDTPSFLNGKTQYNHSDIMEILASADWHEEE